MFVIMCKLASAHRTPPTPPPHFAPPLQLFAVEYRLNVEYQQIFDIVNLAFINLDDWIFRTQSANSARVYHMKWIFKPHCAEFTLNGPPHGNACVFI